MGLWRWISLFFFMLVAGASWAQDTETPAESEPVEEDAAPAADDATGDKAPSGPAEGETYIAEEFTDWILSCVATGTGNDPCRFIQVLSNNEGGRVAQVSIVPLAPGRGVAAAAIIETPLGTLLRVPTSASQLDEPGGLRIKVDDGQVRVFQFTFCTEGGCVAEIGLDQALVDSFKRGRVAELTIWSVDAPGQPVVLSLSLSGFTAGFNRVAELSGVAE